MKRRSFLIKCLSLGSISGISFLYPNQKGNEGNLYLKIGEKRASRIKFIKKEEHSIFSTIF